MKHLIPAVALVLALAACGQPTPTPPAAEAGSVSLTLSMASDNIASQAVTTQGAPFHPSSGATAVQEMRVIVRNSADDIVKFTMAGTAYVADSGGDVTHVTLAKTAPDGGIESADVILPLVGNPYTFESLGYTSDTEPVITYDLQTAVNVRDNATVWLRPTSVLGDALLAPRLPLTYALPGSYIDLMLIVTANGHNHLQVPIGDFEADYDVVPGSVATVQTSNRGTRLLIDDACTIPFSVNGSVRGIVESNGAFVNGSVDMNNGVGLELACPPLTDGGVAFDSEAPTIEIVNYDSSTRQVNGSADDNFGIALVQLFDGPVLIATTDSAAVTAAVAQIEFNANSNSFTTNLTAAPQVSITALAFDTSGNQSSFIWHDGVVSEEFAHCPLMTDVYVSSVTGSASAAGTTRGTPLETLQAAINAAADNNTLCVAAGTYEVSGLGGTTVTAMNINKPLTILGPNHGVAGDGARGPEAEIVVSSPHDDWIMGVLIGSSNVTVDGFRITTNTPKAVIINPSDTAHLVVWGFYVTAGATEFVEIRNNVLVDTTRPIWINRGWGAPATNFLVEGNLIKGPEQPSDQAIMFQSASGEIRDNVIRDTRVGIQVQPYNQSGDGRVEGNDIQAVQTGLWFNYLTSAEASWEFDGNSVLGIENPDTWPLYGQDPDLWSGIRIEQFQRGNVRFTNNNIIAGSANPGLEGVYLLRQRAPSTSHAGNVNDIGTFAAPGNFFASNSFPEITGGLEQYLRNEQERIQLVLR